MPDPTGTKTDGAIQFGSQTTTIGSATFICENIATDWPTRILDSNNQYGVPNKQVIIHAKATGTATLQLPATDTAPPARLAEFTLAPTGGGAAITWILSQVSEA